MQNRETTACFTGHRQLREPADNIADRLSKTLIDLIQSGYQTFCAGGARGFDALAAETVLALKPRFPQIQLVLMLPFPEQYKQEGTWTQTEIEQYHRVQAKASQVITVAPAYSPGIYYQRNKLLVDSSSVCIAYKTRESSGTGHTVRYAQKQGFLIMNLAESKSNKIRRKMSAE